MLKYIACVLLCILSITSFNSCEEPKLSGTDILPVRDDLGTFFTDTLTVITTSSIEDSLISSNLSNYILGSIDEATFGKSHSSISTQVKLPSNNIDLGDSLQFDSLVLNLRYDGSYGDLTVAQSVVVYELDEEISAENTYHSNKTVSYKSTELARLDGFVPNLDDSISLNVEGTRIPASLRIKLDDSFGQNLLDQSGSSNFENNSSFRTYLNGLLISIDSASGFGQGVVYLNLFSSFSKLTLYYHDSAGDSLSFDFPISSGTTADDCAAINHFQHNYNGSLVSGFINSDFLTDNNYNDSLFFVQSMSGVRGVVRVPHLKDLGNISIHKAELVFTQVDDPNSLESTFPEPENQIINAVDSIGDNQFVLDAFIGSSYFGGGKTTEDDSLGLSVNRYKFNLALYYQRIISDLNTDYGLFLLSFPSNRIANRVVLGGGNHSHYPVKLNLTFTKID